MSHGFQGSDEDVSWQAKALKVHGLIRSPCASAILSIGGQGLYILQTRHLQGVALSEIRAPRNGPNLWKPFNIWKPCLTLRYISPCSTDLQMSLRMSKGYGQVCKRQRAIKRKSMHLLHGGSLACRWCAAKRAAACAASAAPARPGAPAEVLCSHALLRSPATAGCVPGAAPVPSSLQQTATVLPSLHSKRHSLYAVQFNMARQCTLSHTSTSKHASSQDAIQQTAPSLCKGPSRFQASAWPTLNDANKNIRRTG